MTSVPGAGPPGLPAGIGGGEVTRSGVDRRVVVVVGARRVVGVDATGLCTVVAVVAVVLDVTAPVEVVVASAGSSAGVDVVVDDDVVVWTVAAGSSAGLQARPAITAANPPTTAAKRRRPRRPATAGSTTRLVFRRIATGIGTGRPGLHGPLGSFSA